MSKCSTIVSIRTINNSSCHDSRQKMCLLGRHFHKTQPKHRKMAFYCVLSCALQITRNGYLFSQVMIRIGVSIPVKVIQLLFGSDSPLYNLRTVNDPEVNLVVFQSHQLSFALNNALLWFACFISFHSALEPNGLFHWVLLSMLITAFLLSLNTYCNAHI